MLLTKQPLILLAGEDSDGIMSVAQMCRDIFHDNDLSRARESVHHKVPISQDAGTSLAVSLCAKNKTMMSGSQ